MFFQYEVSWDYQIAYDSRGFQNNIFLLNHSHSKCNIKINIRPAIKPVETSVFPLNTSNLSKFLQNTRSDPQPIPNLIQPEKKDEENSDTTTDPDEQNIGVSNINESSVEDGSKIYLKTSLDHTALSSNSPIKGSKFYFKSAGECRGKDKDKATEDAFFLHSIALGVSDGVGGWSNYGLSSAMFSESLMKNCKRAIEGRLKTQDKEERKKDSMIQDSLLFDMSSSNLSSLIYEDFKEYEIERVDYSGKIRKMNPNSIINEALHQVQEMGSATAVLCLLKDNELVCANLGDSGFRLIRFNPLGVPFIVSKSEEQQHDFNTPFQLSKLPSKKQLKELLLKKGIDPTEAEKLSCKFRNITFCQDPPECAQRYTSIIQEGDLLILGTDGLFDNLFDDQLLETVRELGPKVHPMEISRTLLEKAYSESLDQECHSPFSQRAKQAINLSYHGGKPDDITALAAWVTKCPSV